MLRSLLLIAVLPCAACSSIIEGSSQDILVNTDPAGANCTITRQGIAIGDIGSTPGSAYVKKTKYDVIIVCNKPGFIEGTYINHSGVAGATFGNIILGGAIGWAVDSASGSDNKYQSPLNITLIPVPASSIPTSPMNRTPPSS